MIKYKNPIIPGFSPDPSICRVGEDFYLVNSTFEYLPGVPVYHSRNLIEWKLLGHALDRQSQIILSGCRNSGGIYAATIRYHNGYFFVITTNVTDRGNFIVYASNPEGPWSEPVWFDEKGIDPSLFWDEDGTCYVCKTGRDNGKKGIIAYEINPFTGEILSDKRYISYGCGGQCVEGPHIYKKNGFYYLMAAEGGTEYGHREVIMRSDCIWGPYIACPHNPILSHTERKAHMIQATGHADLVEDQNGNWWAVFLGIRNFSKALLHNLGRETFLAPVSWNKEGWPDIGDCGKVEEWMEGSLPGSIREKVSHDEMIDFSKSITDYNILRPRSREPCYAQHLQEKVFTLYGNSDTLDCPCGAPAFIGLRQPEFECEFTVRMENSGTAERAGISAFYNNEYHYDIFLAAQGKARMVGVYKHIHDIGYLCIQKVIPPGGDVTLCIRADRQYYHMLWKSENMEEYEELARGMTAGLCTEGTHDMTFTGTLFAMFAEKGTGIFKDYAKLKHIREEGL